MNNTITSSTETLTLTHNQQVRVPALRYHSKIEVITAGGYFIEQKADVAKFNRMFPNAADEMKEWNKKRSEMTLEEFKKDQLEKGSRLPSTLQHSSMICADYPGKSEAMAAERAAEAASPELHDGQLVQIEGTIFKVRVGRVGTMTPVHFDEIGPVE